MGNYLSQSEEELSQSLREEFHVESHPYLLDKHTNQLCTLHKITTNSHADANKIKQIVEEYGKTKCESISKLRAHYHIDKTGYCSDEQSFYLVFIGQNNYTLREQFVKRRFYQTPFKENEILQIIETYLCGLREYNHRFQREYERLSLDSIAIDQKSKKINLKDPWLNVSQNDNDHADNITQILLNYPSPQKLNTAYTSKLDDFNQFYSNLFSVGVMSLEINQLEFVDSLYSRKREINFEEIRNRVGSFKNQKLRKGVECLLDANPNERKKIYQIWGIQNKQQHFLQPILNNGKQIGVVNPIGINTIKNQTIYDANQDLANTRKKLNSSSTFISPVTIVKQQPVYQQKKIVPPTPIRKTDSIWANATPPAYHFKSQPALINPPLRINQQTNKYNFNSTFKQSPPVSLNSNFSTNPQKINFNSNQVSSYTPFTTSAYPTSAASMLSTQPMGQISFKQFLNRQQKSYSASNNIKIPPIFDTIKKEDSNSSFTFKPISQTAPLINKQLNFQFSKPTTIFPSTTIKQNNLSYNLSKPVQINSFNQYSNSFTIPPPKQQNSQLSTLLGGYKESFTFYEPKESIRNNIIRQESIQTYTESPTNYKFEEEKKDILPIKKQQPIQKTSSQIDYLAFLNKKLQQSKNIVNTEIKQQISGQNIDNNIDIASTFNTGNPTATTTNSQKQKEQSQKPEQDKSATPIKPTTKNKYNSTIVEVRDEDSPDHSLKSEDPIEEEYVVEQYQTGSRYEGFKNNGMRNGRGKFYYQDGGYYEGQWKNNKMDGFGKLYYEGGKLAYQGSWSQDEFNGLGKVYNDNPVNFSQPFDYTNFDLLEDYWQYYQGMLMKDTKEGRGKIKLSNGETFEGDFHNDRIQGFGKFYTLDEKIIEGIWRESKLIKVINN